MRVAMLTILIIGFLSISEATPASEMLKSPPLSTGKNSSEEPAKSGETIVQPATVQTQLPVDLLSQYVLLDPKVILARVTRENFGQDDPEERGGRVSRSALDSTWGSGGDLQGAHDGFIIRPFFKYRQEQERRLNRESARNRAYNNYPRYPVFPGK